MIRLDTAALGTAALLFAAFFTNVAMGAAGLGVFAGDIAEMLILFASVSAFTVGVLQREARRARDAAERKRNGA